MNADLKHLIRLQSIDLSIQEIRSKIDQFPSISKALDAKLSEATAALELAREKSKSNVAGRRKLEADVVAFEAKISKYREQMLAVKTNVEYKAFQHEIEHAQAGIRGVEDNILNLMLEAESSQNDIKNAEARLKQDQQHVQEERKRLELENQREMVDIESFIAERKGVESQINADLLTRYERVRKFRDGIGLSPARDYMCEVCGVRIRPQVFQEIHRNDQIINCDACQRILYNPENLDPPSEVA